MNQLNQLTEAHTGFAEVLRLTREAELKALSAANSPIEIAGHIARLLDIDRLLYEHALAIWKKDKRFPFAEFFSAAGSQFSRELLAMHSVWQRKNGQPDPGDGA